jgi:ACS family hexuronate transporter-like MFS transporter
MGITVVNYLDRTCLGVAETVLKRELSIDEQDFSYILVAFQLAYLAQPLAGRLIDWLNLRRGLALSITWWSLAQMLAGLAGGWRSFAFFRGLLGLGEAGNFPAAAKAVSEWFGPRERTVAMGVLNMGAGLGAFVAPHLVVAFILLYGWQSAFVVTGGVGLVWMILWVVLYRSPEQHPWMSPAELAHVRRGQDELPVPQATEEGRGTWRLVLGQKNFWAIALARFMSEPAWQFFTYWIPLYLSTERHLDLKHMPYFASVPFLAADLGCLFGGVLSPLFVRLGLSVMRARKASVTLCAALMVLAIFIGRAPNAAWATAFFCVGAFAHQAISSTLLTLPADLFPRRAVATAGGMAGSVGFFGGMLFTLVVGYVAKTIGYSPLFVGIAFFDLIGAAVLWALLDERPPPQPQVVFADDVRRPERREGADAGTDVAAAIEAPRP